MCIKHIPHNPRKFTAYTTKIYTHIYTIYKCTSLQRFNILVHVLTCNTHSRMWNYINNMSILQIWCIEHTNEGCTRILYIYVWSVFLLQFCIIITTYISCINKLYIKSLYPVLYIEDWAHHSQASSTIFQVFITLHIKCDTI